MDFTGGGCLNDEAFGPAVIGCRGDFDFTIKFEKIFMALLPASVFMAVSLSRIVYLVARRPAMVGGAVQKWTKLLVILVYSALQLVLLVLSATRARRLEAFLVSSAGITFASSLCMGVLSLHEHSRSPRPSILLNGYLSLTVLLDAAQTRTLWLASHNAHETVFARVFTAGIVLKALMILTEAQHKTAWIRWDKSEHSPEETTGLFGLGAFMWLNRLFLMGYRQVLAIDDLYPLDSNMASKSLQARITSHITISSFKNRKQGLARAVAKGLAVPLLLPVGPRIALVAFNLCQPFLINTLLEYLQQTGEPTTRNIGYGLIGASFLIYTGIAISGALYWYLQERAMYMVRGVVVDLVYKKTTEAKSTAADDSAALTLMTADVERIVRGFLAMHEFWANSIEVALACWLLFRQLGAAAFASIVVVAICVVISMFLGRLTAPRQKVWMEKIQKRVGLTANAIGQMKHLKISGLTSVVEDSIQNLRMEELMAGNGFRMILILAAVTAHAPLCMSPVFTFAFASRTLDITTIFTSVSFIIVLASPLGILFQMIPGVIAGFTCVSRIQTFLEADARTDFRHAGSSMEKQSQAPSPRDGAGTGAASPAMKITGATFGFGEEKAVLTGVNLEIPPSQLTIVVGPIASGKSTLCKALLGEITMSKGTATMSIAHQKIGYCDQTAFLTNSTIRDNIVGYGVFDQTRYNQAVEAAMLRPDLALLPKGDLTNIGSNGISLSGGQKQRVSIARALYLDSNFLIFDDTLSGLDADTEEQVFRRVFGRDGVLKQRNATTVLCTHSVRHLPAADHIVALGLDGNIVEQGTFQELMANENYVSTLGVTETEKVDTVGETAPAAGGPANKSSSRPAGLQVRSLDKQRMVGDVAVYWHYFSRLNTASILAFIIVGAGWGFFSNFTTVWLKFWAEDVASVHPRHPQSMYIGLYSLYQIMTLVCLFIICFICFRSMIRVTGSRLHKEALRTVAAAPLSFFTSTDTGVVTNLFSQDMTLIDGELPMALVNLSLEIFSAFGTAAVIATTSPYLVICYPFLAFVLYCIQKFYLRTSRQIRLLDLEAKSPLYSHFIDTIKGLATFRAFDWVESGKAKNSQLLDTSQRPAYLLAMIQRWLGFVLQLVVAVLAVLVVTLATQTNANTAFTGASLVSLMTFGQMLSFIVKMYTAAETSIGAVSRLKTFSEKVVPEDKEGEDVVPGPEWPSRGLIEIQRLSASYRGECDDGAERRSSSDESEESSELAVDDVSLTIAPGEKIAICGRSGSGKSTMILLLLRLLDPLPSCADSITIDGISLNQIDRATLRQRIIAVPQEPVFLPDGTSFGANLDPYGTSTDGECRSVLETIGLWEFVSDRGGLSAGMSADTFSQGQKQLFSMARAILRRRMKQRAAAAGEPGEKHAASRGILLLDEVSSSVDQDTERQMHGIIRQEFENYTVVMISHRLDVVMDMDRVVVMDMGKVVETGQPLSLVQADRSWYKELWLSSGKGQISEK